MGFTRFLLIYSFALLLIGVLATDYYEVLQIAKNAGPEQIKRAYRKLAKKYHPDAVKGSDVEKREAEKKFQEISAAYEVLYDEEKRRIYDRFGEEGLRQHGGGGGRGMHDVFKDVFGGFGGFRFNMDFGGGEGMEEIRKGDDVVMQLEVSLRDVYVGKDIDVLRQKAVLVEAPGMRRCKCRQEITTKQIGPGMFQQFQTQVCDRCPNVAYDVEDDVMTVHVRPGMDTGHEISFFEEGEPVVDGDPGDLRIIMIVKPDDRFRRDGNNLYMEQSISLLEALTGFSVKVTHLDGHKVELSSQEVTRPGQVMKIPGEGMPIFDQAGRGDLYVTYSIDFPSSLSESQKGDIKKILN